MTPDLRAAALQWQAARRPAVVVDVRASRGSVPRDAGTRMIVAVDEVLGTIGGGHLELQATADARALLADPAAAAHRHVALGPSLGQCCGGILDLGFTLLADDAPADWPAPPPRFRLQLYGAGHVGRAIVGLLEGIACEVQWIDERESEFPATEPAPHIRRVCVDAVAGEVKGAPPGAYHLVLTHSHDLDMAIAQEVLARDDVGWFGLIGSATKRARFEHRLMARGLPAERIARMVCPIGVAGIAGKEPAVIAVAVVAQLLQQSGGATGVSFRPRRTASDSSTDGDRR